MKLRHFTIRDLLWFTVLCAVLVAWWMDHSRQPTNNRYVAGELLGGTPYVQDTKLDRMWIKKGGAWVYLEKARP